jgi:hypothetical protein
MPIEQKTSGKGAAAAAKASMKMFGSARVPERLLKLLTEPQKQSGALPATALSIISNYRNSLRAIEPHRRNESRRQREIHRGEIKAAAGRMPR